MPPYTYQPDQIVQGNCIELLRDVAAQAGPVADLIFADPPFNIGYTYDVYEDTKGYQEYHDWTEDWMRACVNVLKPTGTFWVAIGAEYAAEVRMIGRQLGLTLRNWVIWHYTFGQNTTRKFARAHAHLFYFVKDPKNFTFNDLAIRTFSDRERVYKDKRANPKGRLPDDVWNDFPRVCGTFGQREGWHPCQMPEPLLARIIRTCSCRDDLVLDPFAGSGTTPVVAKKLSRHYWGSDISEKYVAGVTDRLAATTPYAELHADQWPSELVELLRDAYAEFAIPTDTLFKSPHLLERFAARFNARLQESGVDVSLTSEAIWQELETLRKARTTLPKIRVHAEEPAGKPRSLAPGLFDKKR